MNEWILYLLLYPILSICLLLIVNWLGKHSYSLGYQQIDFIVDREDNFAFNFSLRVLTPTIFILILSTVFYALKLDSLTKNIYLVVIYSVALRVFINLWLGRFHILDWRLQIFYAISICLLGYAAYYYLILPKKPLIPDFNTISNELWILVGLFIYKLINEIEISDEKKKKRIENYILIKFKNFERLYNNIISQFWDSKIDELFTSISIQNNELYSKEDYEKLIIFNKLFFIKLTYSIMIFEDFNRPRNVRAIENFRAKHSSKTKTLGIMQVKSNKLITDEESIWLAMRLIASELSGALGSIRNGKDFYDYYFLEQIFDAYNTGSDYKSSVISILQQLPEGSEINDEWSRQMKRWSQHITN